MYGDHPGVEIAWLDDKAAVIACPKCGADAYARTRANSGAGHPLHRHVVVACVPCGVWSATCDPTPIPQPDVPQTVP